MGHLLRGSLRAVGAFERRAVSSFLRRHLFPTIDARSLALFRFLYCVSVAVALLGLMDSHERMFERGIYYPILTFQALGIGQLSAEAFRCLGVALVGALLLAAVGAWARVALTASWVGYFLYIGTAMGFEQSPYSPYQPHNANIVPFVLLILSVAPGIGIWGLDGVRRRGFRLRPDLAERTTAGWPIQLVKLTLSLAYFGAGFCKVVSDPLWADGTTLQAYLLQKAMLQDLEAGWWLAQRWWLCLVLGIATLFLELTFWVVCFAPRPVQWLYALSGLAFHTAILITMDISFFAFFAFTYWIFLDWPTVTWLARGGRLPDREAAPAPSPGLGAKVFVGALAATLLGCIVLRVEAWPFTDYRVFQKRKAAGSAWTLRLAIVPEQGQPRWLERDEGALSPRALKRRARFAFRAETTAALRDVLRNEVRWVVGGSRATGELRLYLRQARPDPEAEGGFVFLDTPLYGLPIAAEDGELVIYCDYVRERGRCRNNPPVRIAAPWRHPGPRVH